MIQEGKTAYIEIKNLEQLQRILEDQQKRTVTLEETREVGQSLIDFFAVLAADETNEMVEADEYE